MKKVKVNVEGAERMVISFQCPKCDYFEFEKESSKEVVKELKIKAFSRKVWNIPE